MKKIPLFLAALAFVSAIGASAASARALSGDVNGDGKVNSRDVIAVMKAVLAQNAGMAYPAGFIFKAADMNGDGKLNSRDVISVMKAVIAAEQEPSDTDYELPPGEDQGDWL